MARATSRGGPRPPHRGVSRRPEPLTLDHLSALVTPCRDCVFWELDPVRRARLALDEAASEKRAWISEVLREWGSCGRVVLSEGRPVGYVVYAPPAFVPGAAGFPTAPVSPDAVLLTTVWVDPAHRGGGVGRSLVRAAARDLIERGDVRAIEAFGVRRSGAVGLRRRRVAVGGSMDVELGGSNNGAGPDTGAQAPGDCVVPVDFLGRVGFGTQRAHPRHPRMRMDLRSTLTWRDGVEAALERLVDVVRPDPQPSPTPLTTRTGPDRHQIVCDPERHPGHHHRRG